MCNREIDLGKAVASLGRYVRLSIYRSSTLRKHGDFPDTLGPECAERERMQISIVFAWSRVSVPVPDFRFNRTRTNQKVGNVIFRRQFCLTLLARLIGTAPRPLDSLLGYHTPSLLICCLERLCIFVRCRSSDLHQHFFFSSRAAGRVLEKPTGSFFSSPPFARSEKEHPPARPPAHRRGE